MLLPDDFPTKVVLVCFLERSDLLWLILPFALFLLLFLFLLLHELLLTLHPLVEEEQRIGIPVETMNICAITDIQAFLVSIQLIELWRGLCFMTPPVHGCGCSFPNEKPTIWSGFTLKPFGGICGVKALGTHFMELVIYWFDLFR
jgi:hypothetical protein